MKIYLGLDLDGVILDYALGFHHYLIREGLIPSDMEYQAPANWHMSHYDDYLPSDKKEYITRFSLTDEFANLPTIADAVESVKDIKSAHGDDLHITIVTSAGADQRTIDNRMKNVDSIGLPYNDAFVLPLRADKGEYFKKMTPNTLFVDDLLANVVAADNSNLRGVLFRQNHNRDHSHPYLFEDWNHGKDFLEREFQTQLNL